MSYGSGSNNPIDRFQRGIDRRQEELSRTAGTLARLSRSLARRSSASRVLLIVLGAFSATKAVADKIFGSENSGTLVVYAFVGMLTAAIAGLEVAFHWERRSVDVGVLAATCLANMRDVDTQYRSSLIEAKGNQEQAAIKILEIQDAFLKNIGAESTKQAVNIAFELYPPSEEGVAAHQYPA